jgi:5-formyltetrahydrofolate cyclo-ligase
MSESNMKAALRRQLREKLIGMSEMDRHGKSVAACGLVASTPEFAAASVIMLYLSSSTEVDTSPLALRGWQSGKTICVPRVFMHDKRMLPVEINSLTSSMTTSTLGIREPVGGKPVPVQFIDLVIVPGLGFSRGGYRIGRGMGFYDRFLAQEDFLGVSCGLAFDEQVVEKIPVLDHDMPLSMLVTDRGISRFASNCIQQK